MLDFLGKYFNCKEGIDSLPKQSVFKNVFDVNQVVIVGFKEVLVLVTELV